MELRDYIIRRLFLIIPVLLGASALVFIVLQMFSPVERAALFVRDVKQLQDVPGIIKKYHLDDPLYIQYYTWMKEILQGNLGWSKVVSMPVAEAIVYFLPATVELAVFSAPLIVLGGIFMGSLSAAHKDRALDHGTRALAIVGWSLPTFWLGLILLMIFYGYFSGFLPPERLSVQMDIYVNSPDFHRYTRINTLDGLLNWEPRIFLDALRHLVLPVVTLTVVNIAFVMRIMRSSLLEALGKGFVVTALAKGLSEGEVLRRHARRTALIPVLTVSGYLFAGLMNGVVITETIFNYKGLGWWAWQSAINLDVPSVLGFTLFNAVLFVFTNLVVDMFYAYIDPRVRLGQTAQG